MKTLILNLDYSPLSVMCSKRALVLSIRNPRVKVLEYYDEVFVSEKDFFQVPSVVLYEKYVKITKRKIFSKKHILQRDKWSCQYCGVDLNKLNASVDHVIPVSFFSSRHEANTWENVVACCKKCNYKKANRKPEQAGMKLLKKPKQPRNLILTCAKPDCWGKYID